MKRSGWTDRSRQDAVRGDGEGLTKAGSPSYDGGANRVYWFVLALVAVVLLGLVLRFYPGTPSNDLLVQYAQAQTGAWTDRHPPMGVAILRVLLWTGDAMGAMFVIQNLFYGLGVGLLAGALFVCGRPRTAMLALLASLSPLILFYNTQIYADVTVYSTLVLALGWTAWYRLRERAVPWHAGLPIAVLLIVGMMARANAVFAVGPLAIYLVRPRLLNRTVATIVISVAVAGVGIAATMVFNRSIVHAERSGFDDALPFYDIMGIAAYSDDISGLPPQWNISLEQVHRCYTPHYWDPFTLDFCQQAFQHLPRQGTEARSELKTIWLKQVLRHPLAYAEHRLKHFDAQLNWIEPALQCRYAPLDDQCGNPDPRTGRSVDDDELTRRIRQDYIKKNPVTWPVTWLAITILSLILSYRVADRRVRTVLVAALWSSLFYSGMFLFVGIAANIRYFLWTTVVASVFGALLIGELLQQRYPVMRLVWAFAGTIGAVWILGYAARVGGWAWFIN